MTAINNLPGLAKFNNATHETDGLMSRNDKQKLDTLHKSVTIHTTLYASEWSKDRPYSQKINIPDITSETNGTLTIDPAASNEELQACIDANIMIVDQSINYIEVQVTEEKPEIDIPVVIVFGENLAIITPPTIVDTGNHVFDLLIQPTDWTPYLDTYKTTLYVPGINESLVGSISMKSGIPEDEAFEAAKARIEILNVMDDTVELILRGEKPNMTLHVTVYYGPSIAIVRRPVFGGKITPHAMYQDFDDSKTILGVTNTQSALEEIVIGTTGMHNKPTHFKTVSIMKEAMELQVGQLVTTSGYRSENDGGGATYLITANNDREDNGGSVHILKNGLKAEIVLGLGEDINLKCFGLYGDGDPRHDDTPAFKRGFDFCKQIKGGTVRWQGIANINEPLVVDSHYINIEGYGYGSTLRANLERDYVLSVTYEEHSTTEEIQQIQIGNFRIDGNNVAKHGLVVDDNLPIYNSIFENIYIENTMDYGLVTNSCKNSQFNLMVSNRCYGGLKIMGPAYNLKFDTCEFRNSTINEPLCITYNKDRDDVTDRPSSIQFDKCYFGDSESQAVLLIDKSIDVDFDRCTFDLSKLIDDAENKAEYAIVINEHALYTRFTDCFLIGRMKDSGIIKNYGPHTTIRNFKAVDIQSTIHVLSEDDIHINGLELVGDSTPLIIYTTNDDKGVLDINSVITSVNDDTNIFPTNANYYNFYMNQQDEIGVKGKLNNYVLDKHLENEEFEQTFVLSGSDTFNPGFKLDLPGIWEITTYLNPGQDENQGRISRYQYTFKPNSIYPIANLQTIVNDVVWGNNVQQLELPTVDKTGYISFSFKYTTSTTWRFKVKARRVMGFEL